MGKYMKKGKMTGDVSVMEVSQSVLGVRTRARTLALQQTTDFSYLQLRSRRLQKPQFPPLSPSKPDPMDKHKHCNRGAAHPQSKERSASEGEPEAAKIGSGSKTPLEWPKRGVMGTQMDDFVLEPSFGDNNLEFDGTERGTRESTPCSFIRELDRIGTPGSAVRSTCSGAVYQRQSRNSFQSSIPSTNEMEDFFANTEIQNQQQFMDKYNFDVVNDLPLPGRYEWVRVDL